MTGMESKILFLVGYHTSLRVCFGQLLPNHTHMHAGTLISWPFKLQEITSSTLSQLLYRTDVLIRQDTCVIFFFAATLSQIRWHTSD